MYKYLKLIFLLLIYCFFISKAHAQYLSKNLEPLNMDGSINLIVEISAGDNLKKNFNNKKLEIEYDRNGPRKVNYLPYPFNYGILPKTFESYQIGADGDPLDVIFIAERKESGNAYEGKLLGILYMLDKNETDNKIISIDNSEIFSDVNNLDDLKKNYPGIIEILYIWLKNYKGGQIQIIDLKGKKDAANYINDSKKRYLEKYGN